MTTNKVCGKGKCKFTDEFCASGDCPYDTDNVAQRNSQDKELMKKIFPHKEIIEGESVLVFPYIEEASPLKDVPQEVISKMETTKKDHIVDVNKKVSLTEQWKNGELEQGYYYTRYTPSVGKPFVEIELKNYLIDLAKVRDAETVEVLAPVPSYEKWQGLNKDIDIMTELWKHERSQLNEKIQLIGKLSVQVVDLNNEIKQLKELLKECREVVEFTKTIVNKHTWFDKILIKINGALK